MSALLKRWLGHRIAEMGWSQAELARRVRIDPASLSRSLKGVRQWQEGELERIAELLGSSASDLAAMADEDASRGMDAVQSRVAAALRAGGLEVAEEARIGDRFADLLVSTFDPPVVIELVPAADFSARRSMPSRTDLPALPVLGQPTMEAGEVRDEGAAVGTVPRPPTLAGVEAAYAIRMPDDSMVPRFQAGDTLFVDPTRPARIGADVVVVCAPAYDGARTLAVGRLESRGADGVSISGYGSGQTRSYSKAAVKALHPVVLAGMV